MCNPDLLCRAGGKQQKSAEQSAGPEGLPVSGTLPVRYGRRFRAACLPVCTPRLSAASFFQLIRKSDHRQHGCHSNPAPACQKCIRIHIFRADTLCRKCRPPDNRRRQQAKNTDQFLLLSSSVPVHILLHLFPERRNHASEQVKNAKKSPASNQAILHCLVTCKDSEKNIYQRQREKHPLPVCCCHTKNMLNMLSAPAARCRIRPQSLCSARYPPGE